MFTDAEIGMDLAYGRELRARTAHAQAIIDRQSQTIGRLQAQLAASQRTTAELVGERRERNLQLLLRRRALQH